MSGQAKPRLCTVTIFPRTERERRSGRAKKTDCEGMRGVEPEESGAPKVRTKLLYGVGAFGELASPPAQENPQVPSPGACELF